MSDQFDTGPLPELTPEQESEVRRLLAEARHDEPVPADVATRLDRALADLSREAPVRTSEPVAPVIDLAARRRRRNAAALLAGAAAVIVAGFGIGQAIDVSSDDAGTSTADSAVARDDAEGSGAEEPLAGGQDQAQDFSEAQPLRLRSSHLRRDIQVQLRRLPYHASAGVMPAPETFDADVDCPPAATAAHGTGELFAAYYDGIPAVLALGPPTNGSQEAQVLACTTGEALRSVTVTAP
jgi:hypothetical protein